MRDAHDAVHNPSLPGRREGRSIRSHPGRRSESKNGRLPQSDTPLSPGEADSSANSRPEDDLRGSHSRDERTQALSPDRGQRRPNPHRFLYRPWHARIATPMP